MGESAFFRTKALRLPSTKKFGAGKDTKEIVPHEPVNQSVDVVNEFVEVVNHFVDANLQTMRRLQRITHRLSRPPRPHRHPGA